MTLFFLFVVAVVFERKTKTEKLRHNLRYFPPDKLQHRIEAYENELSHLEDYEEIRSQANELIVRDFNLIKRELTTMDMLSSVWNFFSFIKFRKTYMNLFKSVEEYEDKYLHIRFVLFDLTSDIEIEKAVFKKLKEQTNHINETISNSPIERIRKSSKLENKVNKLRRELKKLNEMIESEGKHLSSDFVAAETKISLMISGLANDVDFMHEHIKHLEEDLNYAFQGIVRTYEKHKSMLVELWPEIRNYIKIINALKPEINEDIDNLLIKKATEKISVLDAQVNELHLLINSNVDYAKYNLENDKVPSLLLEHVKLNHGMFVSEVKRHRLEDEQVRLLFIDQAFTEFEDSIIKFEREKMNQINKHSPQGIHKLLMDTINKYLNYINVVSDKVKDISAVNASTNRMNLLIAQMNTSLLQVEYNIISLTGIQKEKFNNEKEELQEQVQSLRSYFKNNTTTVDEKSFEIVNKTKVLVEELVERSRGIAFETYFLKEIIMYLNRFRGSNKTLDLMIENVSEAYNAEKYKEALRKSKEIIEIYGIE